MRTVTFIQLTQPSVGIEALDTPKRAVYVPAEEIVEVLDGHAESIVRTRTGGQIIASEPAGVVVEYIKAALLAEELRNNPTLAGDIQKLCRLVVELRDLVRMRLEADGLLDVRAVGNRLAEVDSLVDRYLPRRGYAQG